MLTYSQTFAFSASAARTLLSALCAISRAMLRLTFGSEAYFFRPACDRWEGDEQVTKARPGRRYVELVQDFGANGYVFSICNADWTAAVDGIAQMIYDELGD